MFGKKEFIGLTVQDDVIRVAHLMVSGKTVKLIKLDRFSLVERIKTLSRSVEMQSEPQGVFEEADDADAIFGFEDEKDDDDSSDLGDLDLNDLDDLDDLDNLDDLGDFEESGEDDGLSLDMVEESETPQSNEMLVYSILTGFDLDKIQLGLNIPFGNTIFQITRDTDFNEVKKKDLIQDIEEKLESIYDESKSNDFYSYEIREDGSLLLASVDEESPTLQLINSSREIYKGKMSIEDVVPDEVLLVGLIRANYQLEADEITCIIQFGKNRCRLLFMKGEDIWLVSPIINEGTAKKAFLNTIFSKILFQLDMGEVPNLDRIILTNNTVGSSAVEFFGESFPDITVEDLQYNPDFIDEANIDPSSLPAFSTAIGAAFAASKAGKGHFPDLHFVPAYVSDRQKIFKLQWHGMLILFLIFLTPITFNYFYNQNVQQIKELNRELESTRSQIRQLEPIVQNTNELSSDLAELKEKLVLLDTLSHGSKEWSVKFSILNEGMQQINNTWLTSFTQNGDGAMIQGYTLYRNRIPDVVNIFDEATLLNVNIETIRETDIFSFAISVHRFAESDSIYSPATPVEVQQLIGQ